MAGEQELVADLPVGTVSVAGAFGLGGRGAVGGAAVLARAQAIGVRSAGPWIAFHGGEADARHDLAAIQSAALATHPAAKPAVSIRKAGATRPAVWHLRLRGQSKQGEKEGAKP